ncbi:MFS transporter [Haloferax namakaokahaiae]|uniref:MFS transporter n=1 Tax=Haloferax namakaokahaiae TaxID=1748331 RepID=A0ABD5ZIG0_9EURY
MSSLYRNSGFMRLFLGRIVTNAGDSAYGIAAMWLVFELTGSSFYTGLAGFLSFGPQALQFLVGPLIDRWPVRNLLVGTQFAQMVGVSLIPLAAFTGHLSVWVVLVLMPVLAFLNQFVYPAQHAVLPKLVTDDQLVEANSLFSFGYQGTDLVFTALSGALIAVVGATNLFALDAVTFAVAVLLFVGLRIPREEPSNDSESDDESSSSAFADYRAELREGFDYIRGSVFSTMVVGSVVVNAAYAMLIAVLPAFADSLGGPAAYGLVAAAMGGGSLVGTIVASRVEHHPYGRVAIASYVLSAACLGIAFTVSWLPATIAFVFAAFVPSGLTSVLFRSMVQSAIDDSLLGRVFSVISSLSTLMMPVGALFGGYIATYAGVETVVAVLPVCWGLLAVYFGLHPKLRRLPAVTSADELSLGVRRGTPVSDG